MFGENDTRRKRTRYHSLYIPWFILFCGEFHEAGEPTEFLQRRASEISPRCTLFHFARRISGQVTCPSGTSRTSRLFAPC